MTGSQRDYSGEADAAFLDIAERAGYAVPARLDYLRGEIAAERISYGEIAELQSLAAHIDPSDTVLLEWAGVPEFGEDETE